MATISVSLPSDGSTADVADYNTPITTIVNEINGNLDNANIKTGAAIATAKLATDAGIVKGMLGTDASYAWTSWTPTLSGRFTDADWTKNCKYTQIGKTVICKFAITSTDATPMAGGSADCIFTLPVTATALSNTASLQVLGLLNMYDGSSIVTLASVLLTSTTTATIRSQDDSSTGVTGVFITSTTPWTWNSGDEMAGTFTYEAA